MRRLLLLCACLLAAAPAAADEILLRNGDRFSGTVVSLSGGTLTVDTDHGQLRIGWDAVASLIVTDPMLVTVVGTAPGEARIAAGAPGRLVLDPGGEIELARIAALARPMPPLTVDGGANVGFITTTGNTEVNSLRLDATLLVRQRENRYTASAAVNQAEDRGVETARNWNSAVNYDRFLTTRLFVNANAIFTNDRFRDIDLRTALGAGVGYQVLDAARVTLTANGGLGWVNEDFENGADDRYTAARESATLGIALVPDRIQFFHQHDSYIGVTGDENLFFKMTNGVRLGLFGGLVTTAQLDLDYDRSPSPGRENTDQTFALTFGYRF